jgi:phage-related protein
MGWWTDNTPEEDSQLQRIEFFVRRNNVLLNSLQRQVLHIMADLTKLTTDVDALTAAVTAAVTDLAGLSADIAALKAAAPADIQPAIDALAAKVEAASSGLTTAAAANPA